MFSIWLLDLHGNHGGCIMIVTSLHGGYITCGHLVWEILDLKF